MGWVSSVLAGPYAILIKVVGVVLIAVSLFGVGYYKGTQHEKTKVVTQVVTKILKQTEYVTKTEQPKEAAQIKSNQDKHDNAVLQIPQVIIANPLCSIDSNGISVLNSVRGPLPSQQ